MDVWIDKPLSYAMRPRWAAVAQPGRVGREGGTERGREIEAERAEGTIRVFSRHVTAFRKRWPYLSLCPLCLWLFSSLSLSLFFYLSSPFRPSLPPSLSPSLSLLCFSLPPSRPPSLPPFRPPSLRSSFPPSAAGRPYLSLFSSIRTRTIPLASEQSILRICQIIYIYIVDHPMRNFRQSTSQSASRFEQN